MQRAARRVVIPPPHCADLAEPHSGVERENYARIVERQVGEQPLFECRLCVIAQNGQLFRAAVRVNRCRDGIYRHNAVCHRSFTADIEHYSHIFDAFRAQRAAGAQISMQRLPVQKPLHDRCCQLVHRQTAQLRQDVLVHVVAVMLVTARLRHRLNIRRKPLLSPSIPKSV